MLSNAEKVNIATEDEQYSKTERSIIGAADSPEFLKKISPESPEKIDVKVLDYALETLLNADGVELSRTERMQLFQTTLEYYSSPTEAMLPLWHSTSSYTLRKGLEEGFAGGHGKYSGEASTYQIQDTQKALSVSHPEYHYAEVFQQMFARATCKRIELSKYLAVDSEKITGRRLPKVFLDEMLSSFSDSDKKVLAARMLGIKPEEVTEEQIEQLAGQEAQNKFTESFGKREDTHQRDLIKKEILSNIEDKKLRAELEEELEHPFPCFITFEGSGKEQNLTTVSRGEKPTHIPFEDMYWGMFTGGDIREIRVPQSQMGKVQGWLEAKGLNGIKIVPIEVYEVKRIIQNSVK